MTRIEALRSALNSKIERSNSLRAALQEYATRDGEPTAEERAQFETDVAEFEAAGPDIERMQSELAQLEAIANAPERAREVAAPTIITRQADPIADESAQYGPTAQVRGAARTAIENIPQTTDAVREGLTAILERADDPSGKLSRHLIAASRPAYRSAWSKMISGQEWALDDEEKRSIQHVRAASLTDASGGYAVPTVLDPTLIVTGTHNGFVPNPIRQLARTVSITGDNYNYVTTAGVTAAWAAEAAEVADGAPTLASSVITPIKAHVFVPFSMEIQGDWAAMESELRGLMMVAKDDLEATGFTTGTGSTQPLGLFYDMYTNYTGQTQASASADTFAVADVYALANKVANRFRGRGTFLANQLIFDKVRQFDTGGGANLWVQLAADQPASLLGRPAYAFPEIDGTYGSGENYVMGFGSVNEAYTIVDRVGMSVELVPHMFATGNNRPDGQRGLYAWWRVGARVVNSTAFAILNVT